ncbi:O-antigen ligase family protein [Formosa sp. S-31]
MSLNMLALFFLPYKRLFALKKHFYYPSILLFCVFLIFNIIIIILGIMNRGYNSIFTVLGNSGYTLYHCLPFFMLLSLAPYILKKTNMMIYWVLIISIPCLLFLFSTSTANITNVVSYFFIAFIPFIENRKKRWLMFLLLIITSIINAFYVDNRSLFIVTFLMGFIYCIYNFSPSLNTLKQIAKPFALTLLTIPFLFLSIGHFTGFSIFNLSEEFEFLASDKNTSKDTRTFIWKEVFNDLSKNEALLFGKGMNGTIKTELPSFVDPTVKDGKRQFLEAGFLEYLRRGGLIYAILETLLVWIAIFYAIKHSNNKFLIITAMALSTYFALSFIGITPAFSLESVTFWVLTGCCLSKENVKLTDKKILKQITS